MAPLLVNSLAFLTVFLAVFALNAVVIDLSKGDRQRIEKQFAERQRNRQRERIRTAPLPHEFGRLDVNAEEQVQIGFAEKVATLIEQSGVDITVSRLCGMAAISSAIAGLAVGLLLQSLLWVGPAAIAGASMPWLYIMRRRRQRLNQLLGQLPDAFDMMGRVIRAGQTISQAMQAVGDEFSRPVSLELLYCSEQMNLGLSPEAALRDLARRTGLLELRIFSLAVLVHRQTGGNLAELLDKLANLVRERFRIRGMISSLTAQGRLQAGILVSLPPAMFLLLMILHPTYESMLLDYPSMIFSALGMMLLGWLWIRRIVNFDF